MQANSKLVAMCRLAAWYRLEGWGMARSRSRFLCKTRWTPVQSSTTLCFQLTWLPSSVFCKWLKAAMRQLASQTWWRLELRPSRYYQLGRLLWKRCKLWNITELWAVRRPCGYWYTLWKTQRSVASAKSEWQALGPQTHIGLHCPLWF